MNGQQKMKSLIPLHSFMLQTKINISNLDYVNLQNEA